MMTPTFFLCITLLCCTLSTTSLTVEDVVFDYRDDLKLFLDWVHEFSRAYEAEKIMNIEELNKQKAVYMVASVENIDDTLTSFISSATHLRSVLVKGNPGNAIRTNPEDNVKFLTTFLVTMSFVFDDLQKNIEEWEVSDPIYHTSSAVTDEAPFIWFKEHGFDESSLNDISIQKLKEEVNKLYGDRKPFDKILSLFGTLLASSPPGDIGSKLGWLAACGANKNVQIYLQRYLRDAIGMDPKRLIQLLNSLYYVGYEYGPLRRLFGNGRDDKLHPFIMPMLKRASYKETRVEIYMKALAYVLSHIDDELKNLRRALKKDMHTIYPIRFYREFGFIYDKAKLRTENSLHILKRLIEGYGLKPRLMKHVKMSVKT